MANTIITKNSSTASAVPTSGDLVQGELAVNVTDKRLFTEDSGGNVVEVGTNPSTMAVAGNATVGGTLGVTGATTLAGASVTSLTNSGATTLSSGTANAVTYLNGSKVLTSGSALTFDGTNFKVGTAVTLATGGPYFSGGNIDAGATTLAIGASTTGFFIGGSEQMRLTSTGLGIGTSSPSVKLHVASTGRDVAIIESTDGGALNGPYLNLYRNSASPAASDYLGFLQFSGKNSTGSAVDYAFIGAQATQVTTSPAQKGDLVFFTANQASPAERMRIDSSGNVGIGTSSPNGRLTVSGSSLATSWTVFGQRSDNTTLSGMTTWESASGNVGVRNNAGALTFMTGGTIGTSIGDERMRLDSSGNLGLGVTPSAWSASGTIWKAIDLGSTGFVAGRTGAERFYAGSNGYFNGTNWIYKTTGSATYYASNLGQHEWYTAPSGTAGNAISFTQAMTLDASGNLALGTTSALSAQAGRTDLTVNGSSNAILSLGVGGVRQGYLYTPSSGVILAADGANAISFWTNSSERARIDSSGNLLVGTTATYGGAKITFERDTNSTIQVLRSNSYTSGTNYYMQFFAGATETGKITSNGTNNTYATSSDYRLKENIQPMQNALSVVEQLNPVTYTWKVNGSEGQGFIAHELQAVVPDCVVGEKDAVDAEGNPVYQGIDTSFLVATLTAALQEAHGLIKDLQARVDALEAK